MGKERKCTFGTQIGKDDEREMTCRIQSKHEDTLRTWTGKGRGQEMGKDRERTRNGKEQGGKGRGQEKDEDGKVRGHGKDEHMERTWIRKGRVQGRTWLCKGRGQGKDEDRERTGFWKGRGQGKNKKGKRSVQGRIRIENEDKGTLFKSFGWKIL